MSINQSSEVTSGGGDGGGGGGGEFMLFGVRIVVDSMRKSVSLNNLSQYEHRIDLSSDKVVGNVAVGGGSGGGGYASADDAVVVHRSSSSSGNRERKRGVPWTEEEHKRFLVGLEKVGKGDWRGISRDFVKTRTPTQVASHAQKYFLRRTNLNRRRRRSSLFDITPDSVVANSTNDRTTQENTIQGGESQQQAASANPEMSNVQFTISSPPPPPIYSSLPQQFVATPACSHNSMAMSLDPPSSPLSLNLSLSLSTETEAAKATPSNDSAFWDMQGFSSNSDGMISVA